MPYFSSNRECAKFFYMLFGQISPIQSLVGQSGRRWVMGLISQLEDGHFYLEDLTASVEVNLTNTISLIEFYHHLKNYFANLKV